jgi:hypothetical protein
MGGAIIERPSLLHIGTAVRDGAAARAWPFTSVAIAIATKSKPRRRADPPLGSAANLRGTRRIAFVIPGKTPAVYLRFFFSQSGRVRTEERVR